MSYREHRFGEPPPTVRSGAHCSGVPQRTSLYCAAEDYDLGCASGSRDAAALCVCRRVVCSLPRFVFAAAVKVGCHFNLIVAPDRV